jgi:hypothetical protein
MLSGCISCRICASSLKPGCRVHEDDLTGSSLKSGQARGCEENRCMDVDCI